VLLLKIVIIARFLRHRCVHFEGQINATHVEQDVAEDLREAVIWKLNVHVIIEVDLHVHILSTSNVFAERVVQVGIVELSHLLNAFFLPARVWVILQFFHVTLLPLYVILELQLSHFLVILEKVEEGIHFCLLVLV